MAKHSHPIRTTVVVSRSISSGTATSTYVVFVVIFCVMAVPLMTRLHDPGAQKILAMVLAGALAVFIWLHRFRIQITDSEIVFKSLFGGTQRISRSETADAHVKIKVGPTNGPLRLIVQPRRGSSSKPIEINAKVFSRDTIQAVIHAARPPRPN